MTKCTKLMKRVESALKMELLTRAVCKKPIIKEMSKRIKTLRRLVTMAKNKECGHISSTTGCDVMEEELATLLTSKQETIEAELNSKQGNRPKAMCKRTLDAYTLNNMLKHLLEQCNGLAPCPDHIAIFKPKLRAHLKRYGCIKRSKVEGIALSMQ